MTAKKILELKWKKRGRTAEQIKMHAKAVRRSFKKLMKDAHIFFLFFFIFFISLDLQNSFKWIPQQTVLHDAYTECILHYLSSNNYTWANIDCVAAHALYVDGTCIRQ